MSQITESVKESCEEDRLMTALTAVSAVFGSLGRVLVCLDRGFRIVHTSSQLDSFFRPGASAEFVGRPASELLGEDLFGTGGTLTLALSAGERREGWRASLVCQDGTRRLLSITASPFCPDSSGVCDPRVSYIVVLRPAEEDVSLGTTAPTVFSGLIARSAAMEQIFDLIENLEGSDATILLTGESGTGKEVAARAIHSHSSRRRGPFVAVNCGGLPGELLESELFGHVRGAFTGAIRDRIGRFEAADNGTLFLDEIGDLPVTLQVKLLRVLQEKTFERVGETRSLTTNARIIAATNLDLRRAVETGRFREDLYYRLRVVPIEIPPLRARREDIEPIARFLLGRVADRHGRVLRFSPEAMRHLLQYDWPGNVRELENSLEYATAVCRGQTILPEDLPAEIKIQPRAGDRERRSSPQGKREDAERERVIEALDTNHWRREPAARSLGISRATLWRKMRELDLLDR